ncbi:PLP-dependent aminotransferase family protein [Roseibium sp.]|uniref:aminotransferase-like domain-containing protein n=1 Tax=Roseibium sp. TaxID=1936156 RepID=UPI003B520033
MMTWDAVLATRAKRMSASEIRELLKLLDQPDIISFAGGIPDPALFPSEAFKEAYGTVLSGEGASSGLQYSVSEGNVRLRTWLAGEMAKLGIDCTPDNILITSGSQQALDFIGKLFLSAGDTALVGWPTYLGALQAFNAYEPNYDRLDPMTNRSAGDYRTAAAAAGGSVKFAYLSPDFANPTGETLDEAGRTRLLSLADELECAVIEDGAYQSLRYDGEPVPPVLALDCKRSGGIENTRTLYCGSFSKTLSPGLRLGWVCGAKDVISRLVLLKQAGDLHSSSLNQEAMAHVAETVFEAQVGKIRKTYRERRDAMLTALENHMPFGTRWTRPEGGMFVWVELPEGIDAAALLKTAVEEAKVAFVPGKAFFADGSGTNTLRLSFSATPPEKITEGISRLGEMLAKTDRCGV